MKLLTWRTPGGLTSTEQIRTELLWLLASQKLVANRHEESSETG